MISKSLGSGIQRPSLGSPAQGLQLCSLKGSMGARRCLLQTAHSCDLGCQRSQTSVLSHVKPSLELLECPQDMGTRFLECKWPRGTSAKL